MLPAPGRNQICLVHCVDPGPVSSLSGWMSPRPTSELSNPQFPVLYNGMAILTRFCVCGSNEAERAGYSVHRAWRVVGDSVCVCVLTLPGCLLWFGRFCYCLSAL